MRSARRYSCVGRRLWTMVVVGLLAVAVSQCSWGQDAPVPLIVDDDGSADGMVGLTCLLQAPEFEVRAVTIANGLAHPDIFAPLVRRMLVRLGRAGIPVAAGRLTPLVGTNAFPDPWRGDTDRFWDIALPPATESAAATGAAELIVRVVKEAPRPVAILATGPLTNVAEAIRLDPTIAGKIRLVQVMGGAMWVPGNVGAEWPAIQNRVAEWNIWVDPVAADEVLASGIKVRFVPLDTTNRMTFTAADAEAWRKAGTPAGSLAADLLAYLLKQISPTGVSIWDTVAAVDLCDPQSCSTKGAYVDVITDAGPEQGWTKPYPGRDPNCVVAVEPKTEQIRADVARLLRRE
jgi:pyrimidine-specific ribonucleoside hydrolase